MALKDILARARKPTPSASMEAASQRAGAPALSSLAPPGEFRKGLRRGAAGLESSLYGVADLAGSVTDHPELQHWAQQGMADAAQVEAENEAKVKSITDVHSLSDVMDWALGKGGEAAPALASMAVAGGVGAKVGEGLVGEAAAGSTERQLAAHGLRRAAAERTGALAGGYASAAVPAVGGTFEDIEQKTGQEAPLTSLGAGAIEGAVAFAPEAWLARKFVPALGGTLEHTGRDILREIGYQTAAQGAAGAGQEAIAAGARKLVDPTESLTSPENIKRYEEGAATGALLGATTAGAVSGGAHILGRALSRVSDPKDHQGAQDAKAHLQAMADEARTRMSKTTATPDQHKAVKLFQSIAKEGRKPTDAETNYIKEHLGPLFDQGGEEAVLNAVAGESGKSGETQALGSPTAGESNAAFNSINESNPDPAAYLTNGRNQVWQSKAASEALAGKKFEEHALQKKVDKLNAENDGNHYSVVPVREMLKEQAAKKFDSVKKQRDYLAELGRKKYEQLVKQRPAWEKLYDPKDPSKFLNHFEVIRKEPAASATSPHEPIDFTHQDLHPDYTDQEKATLAELRRQKQQGDPSADEGIKAIEKAKQDRQIVKDPGRNGKLRRGEFKVKLDGKEKHVNAMNLTLAAMHKMAHEGEVAREAAPTPGRVAEAFTVGLSSLLNHKPDSKDIRLAQDKLPDSLIVFTSKKETPSRTYTLGELRRSGAERLAYRRYALSNELESLQGWIKQAPKEISSTSDPVRKAKLRENLAKARKLAEPLPGVLKRIDHELATNHAEISSEEAATRHLAGKRRDQKVSPDTIRAKKTLRRAKHKALGKEPVEPISSKTQTMKDTTELEPVTMDEHRITPEERAVEKRRRSDDPEFYRETQAREALKAILYGTSRKRAAELYKIATGDDPGKMSAPEMVVKLNEQIHGRPFHTLKRETPVGEEAAAQISEAAAQISEAAKGAKDSVLPKLRSKGTKAHYKALQAQAESWAAKIGLKGKFRVMEASEAIDHVMAHPEDGLVEGLMNGSLHGFVLEPKNGEVRIFVHPDLKGKVREEILAHEMGHAIFQHLTREMTPDQAKAILTEFKDWFNQAHQSNMRVEDLIHSKKTPDAALAALVDNIPGTRLSEVPEDMRRYLLDFEEWFADRTAAHLLGERKGENATDSFFRKIAKATAKLAGLRGADEPNAVGAFMDSLAQGTSHWNSAGTVWDELRTAGAKMPKGAEAKDVHKEAARLFQEMTGRRMDKALDPEQLAYTASLHGYDVYGVVFNQAMRTGFDNLLTPEERGQLGHAAMSSPIQRQMRRLLATDSHAIAEIERDPRAAAAYMYQFWLAGKLTTGPRARGLFGRVREYMNKLFGYMTDHKKAAEILENYRNSSILLRERGHGRSVVQRAVSDSLLHQAARGFAGAWKKAAPVFESVFSVADVRMRRTKNPILRQVVDLIKPEPGSERKGEGMLAARTRMLGQFDNMARNIYEGKSEEFGQQALKHLQEGTKLDDIKDPEVRTAVRKTRSMLRHVLQYMQDRRVPVGDLGEDYFPWVFDQAAAMNHGTELHSMLMQDKFREPMDKLAERYGKEDRKAVADAILAGVQSHSGYADFTLKEDKWGHMPTMGAINERTLQFVHDLGDAKDKAVLSKVMSKDLGRTLRTYVEQAVKRAEYVDRFGPDGKLLDDYAKQAINYGATKKDLDLLHNYMNSVLGTHGVHTNRWLTKMLGWKEPKPGEVINPKLQKAMGAMMVYQNIRILGMATFTSLADPIGIAVRSGDAGLAFRAFKEGLRSAVQAAKGDTNQLHSLAEALGTIDLHMTAEALGWEYGGVYLSDRARRLNEGFFKWIGLNWWTRTTRLMGLAGAQAFIKQHALHPSKHSERYLDQLNLKSGDVKLDDNEQLKVLSYAERNRLHEEGTPKAQDELARDDRVRVALNRFVDEAILRPDATQRPIWASDPHFMLIFHMKSFTYAFTNTILRRVISEAGEGNLAPMMQLLAFIPAMMGVTLLKDLIKNGGEWKGRPGWGIMDYATQAADTAGLPGTAIFGIGAMQNVEHGGIGVTSFLGPTAEQLADTPKLLGSDNNARWKTFESALPGQNVWGKW